MRKRRTRRNPNARYVHSTRHSAKKMAYAKLKDFLGRTLAEKKEMAVPGPRNERESALVSLGYHQGEASALRDAIMIIKPALVETQKKWLKKRYPYR